MGHCGVRANMPDIMRSFKIIVDSDHKKRNLDDTAPKTRADTALAPHKCSDISAYLTDHN